MIYNKSKAKDIIDSKEKINEIVGDTITKMANIVGRTLGPGGNPVLIDRGDLAPLITKDGVTVAKSLGISNAAANIVVDACKEICINTATEAGDGTTTAIVLADALVSNGQRFLAANPKYNPQKMINELKDAYTSVVVPFLEKNAIETTTEDQLLYVATISANGDKEIATAVVEAVSAAGDNGTVLITEGQGRAITVDTVDGFVVTTGLKELGQIGPAFINDKAGQQVKMDAGRVFLYDGALNDLHVPAAIQDALADDAGYTDGAPIVVFAHDFSDPVLDKFAKTTKSGLSIIPVKSPRSGLPNGASMFLDDMASYCSATVINAGNVGDLDEDDFGSFTEARVNMYESFIIGTPEIDSVNERVTQLKAIEEQAFSEMDRSWVRSAIAKLTCGVSTIVVGGTTDLEIREKKGRVEDAVEAVRSAIAEGIITGGCTSQLTLSKILTDHDEFKPSWAILANALKAPFRLLLDNCGEDVDSVWFAIESEINAAALDNRLPTIAFDANNHNVANPLEIGLIEPAKVCRVSINNALSVASLLTTLGGIVVVPVNSELEQQMELADRAFQNMMNTVED
jgi:chaperonin GroEL